MEKQKHITLRVSNDEYLIIKEQADVAALSVSEYIRRRVFSKRVVSKLDMRILAELRRLGGLLKHVHTESDGEYSEDTGKALTAINTYVRTALKQLNKKSL
jgi:hypothetical protein